MSPTEFCRHYPRLYHMAETGTWESIRKHGLLSTSALLDLFEIAGEQKKTIESKCRSDIVRIRHDEYGEVAIRDNKPLPESKLIQCLNDGTTPEEWYRLLNGKVFFWPTEERVLRLLQARAYRGRPHLVITVDSMRLLEIYVNRVSLSPINSGAAPYSPTPRGKYTFCRLHTWPGDTGPRSGKLKNPVAELAVDCAVDDIEAVTDKVREMQQGGRTSDIWVHPRVAG